MCVCVEVSMCASQKERGTSGSNLTTSAYGSDQLAFGWHDVSFFEEVMESGVNISYMACDGF